MLYYCPLININVTHPFEATNSLIETNYPQILKKCYACFFAQLVIDFLILNSHGQLLNNQLKDVDETLGGTT